MPSHALCKRVWHDSIYNLRSNCSAKHYPARHSLSERSAVKNLGQRASAKDGEQKALNCAFVQNRFFASLRMTATDDIITSKRDYIDFILVLSI